MSGRVVLRVKCDRGKHTVAKVVGTPTGYQVQFRVVVLTGYGNRFDLHDQTYPIDGPAEDPEVWATYAGCRCGHQFAIDSHSLRGAIKRGDQVITATAWQVQP